MKSYLVDTNIPSELTRDKPDVRVAAFLANAGRKSVFLSVLTIGEICKGIAELPASQKRTGLQDWLDTEVRRAYLAGDRSHRRAMGTFGRRREEKGNDPGRR